jgi:hypothetical protein
MTPSLYEQIVDLTEEYLGPAAQRFVARQISSHLEKDPEDLTSQDIATLIEWGTVTMSMLTQDRRMVEDYATKMRRLMA